MNAAYGEKQREDQIRAANAQQQFQTQLAVNKDAREEQKTGREAQSAKFLDTLRMSRAMRAIDPQLDVKDRIAIERLVRDKARDLAKDADNQRIDPKDVGPALEAYTRELNEKFQLKQQQKGGGPGPQGTAPAQSKPAAGGAATLSDGRKITAGDGKTQDRPLMPQSLAEAQKVPPGAFFYDPASKRVLQRKQTESE